MKRALLLLAVAAAAFATPRTVTAQVSANPPGGVWKLETIVLKDGSSFGGLLQVRTERQIDFAEIVQRPGKPTYAIVRGIEPAQVSRIELLEKEERQELAERFRQLRYRAVIEAGRMEEVRLRNGDRGGKPVLLYEGDWFALTSSADDESTRRWS